MRSPPSTGSVHQMVHCCCRLRRRRSGLRGDSWLPAGERELPVGERGVRVGDCDKPGIAADGWRAPLCADGTSAEPGPLPSLPAAALLNELSRPAAGAARVSAGELSREHVAVGCRPGSAAAVSPLCRTSLLLALRSMLRIKTARTPLHVPTASAAPPGANARAVMRCMKAQAWLRSRRDSSGS